MLDFLYVKIIKFVVYFVGNKVREEGIEVLVNVFVDIGLEMN